MAPVSGSSVGVLSAGRWRGMNAGLDNSVL